MKHEFSEKCQNGRNKKAVQTVDRNTTVEMLPVGRAESFYRVVYWIRDESWSMEITLRSAQWARLPAGIATQQNTVIRKNTGYV